MSRIAFVVLLSCLAVPSLAADDGPTRDWGGPYGGVAPLPRDELTLEHRRQIERVTAESIARLEAEGRLTESTGTPVLFDWPVAPWNGLTAFGIEGISNYVDHNPNYPGSVLDYLCGSRTYDLANGYNHRGTDIFSWPNPWLYMSRNKIAVIAAAPGTIIFKDDGRPDMSCGFNSLPWNAVYVRHDDGTVAWYGHLKTGSATTRNVGDRVETGEYLGIMGSSGSSTAPHLHFELWEDASYTNLLDPWQGACNSLNPTSLWQTQEPYYVTVVNDLTVGATNPVLPACPQLELPNEQYDFSGGQTIYFTMYLRDQQNGQVTNLAILRPDGTTWANWQHNSTQYYQASYWWWWWNMPTSPTGNWTFRVTLAGQVYQQQFNIGSASAGAVPTHAGEGSPLTVTRRPHTNQFVLNWGDSCKSSDSDYVIYEGDIGEYTTFERKTCSTGGEREWRVTTPEADRYWLVAPRNAGREGSAGTDSAGNLRPQAPLGERCAARMFACGP